METFDPTKVISSRPWFDKAIEAVAPSWGRQRLQSRVETALFSYNAAQTNRLYAPKTYGQPSESSQTSRSRVVMMWEARDLVENFPEAREITRKFGNYLTPNEYSPTTGDRDYNQVVSEFFHEWCKRCDVTGRHTFKKLVQLACEERPVDGDCGFAIRRIGDDLKVQMIPGTRIGDPNSIGAESDNYYQGIITDEFGKPVAYRIYRVTREGVYFGAEDVAAHNFCHYFDPFRVDQYRGITDFHAAIRTARMLYEILEAEKAGVRFASQQAALVFNDRGTANPRNLFTPSPASVMANGQTQQNEMSEVGMIRYMGVADRVEVMPSRPSAAFSGFVQHLMHEIAIGVGVPEGVLFGTQDYKGPSVRAEFAAADRVFTRHQGVLTDKVLDPIKNAVILDAIARGEIAPPTLQAGETMVQALRRATAGEWRFPAKLSIDVGRESAANLNENRQGAKSLQEIAGEEGTDAFSRLEQIAIEAAYVKELAGKYGVPETAIRLVTSSLPSTPAAAAAVGENVATAAAQAQVDATPATAQPAVENAPADSAATGADSSMSSDLITINFADGSYVPNDAMTANAKRALAAREKASPSNRGMTAVGLARARDIVNKRPLSEETVRRMKAYFDRHEIDKQGTTWGQQGKGWQAWNGWGGDAGQTWANAIVERLNRHENSAVPTDNRVEFSAATEIAMVMQKKPENPDDWLTAVEQYRKELNLRSVEAAKPIVDKSLVAHAFIMPTPAKNEKADDFLSRCMANPTMVADYKDEPQRYAVCQTQLKARE